MLRVERGKVKALVLFILSCCKRVWIKYRHVKRIGVFFVGISRPWLMAYMYLFHQTSIKTKFLTISATLCNNHTNKYIIPLFFLRFLLRSTKLARPKQMLKSQFSVGPFADSVCVASSWASQKLLLLCNSPSIKLIWWHVHCFTEQTTVIWHISKLL